MQNSRCCESEHFCYVIKSKSEYSIVLALPDPSGVILSPVHTVIHAVSAQSYIPSSGFTPGWLVLVHLSPLPVPQLATTSHLPWGANSASRDTFPGAFY